jgi:hypothetical protein
LRGTVTSQLGIGSGAAIGSDVEDLSYRIGGSGEVCVHPIKEAPSTDRTMPALNFDEMDIIVLLPGN